MNQQEFGKYGILRESDSFKKQQEFEAWMVEQKKIQDAGLLGKAEIKELFREYMEDYNTGGDEWLNVSSMSSFPCGESLLLINANMCPFLNDCHV